MKLDVLVVPGPLEARRIPEPMVFSLHENPEQVGSNTGEGQMDLPATVREKTVSVIRVLLAGLPPEAVTCI